MRFLRAPLRVHALLQPAVAADLPTPSLALTYSLCVDTRRAGRTRQTAGRRAQAARICGRGLGPPARRAAGVAAAPAGVCHALTPGGTASRRGAPEDSCPWPPKAVTSTCRYRPRAIPPCKGLPPWPRAGCGGRGSCHAMMYSSVEISCWLQRARKTGRLTAQDCSAVRNRCPQLAQPAGLHGHHSKARAAVQQHQVLLLPCWRRQGSVLPASAAADFSPECSAAGTRTQREQPASGSPVVGLGTGAWAGRIRVLDQSRRYGADASPPLLAS